MSKSKIDPPVVNMATYRPDAKAVNQALWGSDELPTEKEHQQRREKTAEDLKKLRDLGKPQAK